MIDTTSTTSDTQGLVVSIEVLCAGTIPTPRRLYEPGALLRPGSVPVPALFALIRHAKRGWGLFDTGYAPRFLDETRRGLSRALGALTRPDISPQDSAVAQLRDRGVEPDAVAWIVLSHFDADHIAGLRDFPQAEVFCSRAAWQSVAGARGIRALRERLVPGLLPDDLPARIHPLSEPTGRAIASFPRSGDLFGDGSIETVSLPGHATGQIGAFVHKEGGEGLLLAADAVWTRASLRDAQLRTGVHRALTRDASAQETTLARLRQVQRDYPEWSIVPSHCTEAWAQHRP